MAELALTFASGFTDRVAALATGEVKPKGIDLTFVIEDAPRKIFDRMTSDAPYDACEMSLSEFITRFDAGQCPLVAIPVFTSRIFRHSFVVVNRKRVQKPADLNGKRIGVPIYTMTAAVYIRGLLAHEYGVDLSTVEWLTGDLNKPGGHGNPNVMPVRTPLRIERNTSASSLGDLLGEGAIDAIIGATLPAVLGRHPDVVRLFPRYYEAEAEYYARTKIFPIMHVVAVRKELYERHPFVAQSLFDALSEAKKLAAARLHSDGTLPCMLPWMMHEVEQIDALFGEDAWPYGIEPNRPTLEALSSYLAEQGMTSRAVPIDDLFVTVELGEKVRA